MLQPPPAAGQKQDPTLFPKSTMGPRVAMLPPPTGLTSEPLPPTTTARPATVAPRPQTPAAAASVPQPGPYVAPSAAAPAPQKAESIAQPSQLGSPQGMSSNEMRVHQLQQEMAGMRAPEPPALGRVPAPPAFQQTSPFEGIAPIVMLLSAMAAGTTKRPAKAMLGAFAAFNNARREDDYKRMETAHTAWKAAAEQVVKDNDSRLDNYRQILDSNKTDQRAIQAELMTLATADKNWALLEKLQTDQGLAIARSEYMTLLNANNKFRNYIAAYNAGIPPNQISQYTGQMPDGEGDMPGFGGLDVNTPPALLPGPDGEMMQPPPASNNYQLPVANPIEGLFRRPADIAKATQATRKENIEALKEVDANVERSRRQDNDLVAMESVLDRVYTPSLANRTVRALGPGFSNLVDLANKLNIKLATESIPPAAMRNFGIGMETRMQQAQPSLDMSLGAAKDLVTMSRATNLLSRDYATFMHTFVQPQQDANGQGFLPSAADARDAYDDYVEHAGSVLVDGPDGRFMINPNRLSWKEYFPLKAAAKQANVDAAKAVEFYRVQKAKGRSLQEVMDYFNQRKSQ